jgi:hypothetical protein|nr:MAG TPA: hypothetical protein [Caudoviricetes sp.]
MGKEVCIVNSECFKTEYPVGSTISIEGVNCKVVEDIGLYCNDCILGCKREGITCRNLACLNNEREDRKDVHFVKIESHE